MLFRSPVLSATQPTCSVPTGTITLTPATGVEYQLDAGTFGAYPTGGWSGLAPGSHTVNVRNSGDNTCTSSASITISSVPNAPAQPVLSATQPTCSVPTGTITLTPATGVEYQLDAGTFGAYPTGGWSGLAPGSHTVNVRNSGDNTCTSSASITISSVPNAPAQPVLSATQPTCSVPTGTITLTPATGVEYQLDAGTFGAYPTGGWSGLAPGSHTVNVRNIVDNTCTSNANNTISSVTNAAAQTVLSATQPTCSVPTGTITLTPATGVEYQLDA